MANLEANQADAPSPKKMRIFAQMFGYERYMIPKTVMVQSPVDGLMYPQTEEYREHEGTQFAVNHNDLFIREADLDKLLEELCKSIKMDIKKRGMLK